MKIVWTPRAGRNRADQIEYVAEQNPRAALRLGDRIEESVSRLVDHPLSGRAGRMPGTRELVISGTPYIVVYRVEPDQVTIIRLLHSSQRWPPRRP